MRRAQSRSPQALALRQTPGLRLVALLAAALLCCAGCVAPAFDSGAFKHNAIQALDSAQSTTTTAVLALKANLEGRMTQAYVDTLVTEAEDGIGPIQDSFGSVDPPTTADHELRNEVTQLLGNAADALAGARIAVREHNESDMRQSVTALAKLADQLEQKSQALS